MREFLKNENSKERTFVIAGGVAANLTIRENLTQLSNEMNFEIIYPDLKFCGDNASMIAWAGIQRFKKKLYEKENGIVK